MSSPGLGQASSSDGRDFAWMWLALRKHAIKITLITVLASAITALFLLARTKEYTAHTEIFIGPVTTETDVREDDAEAGPDGVDLAELESEVRLIGSSRIVQKVIEDLGLTVEGSSTDLVSLVTNWLSTSPARSGDSSSEAVTITKRLNAFRQQLTIERDPQAYVVTIGYTSPDRERAALVANAVARAYLDDRVELKRTTLAETASNLKRNVDEMAAWLKSKEQEIDKVRADADFDAVSGTSPAEQSYHRLTQQLTEAELALADARSRLSHAEAVAQQNRARNGIDGAQASPVISALRREEAELQNKIDDLGAQFGVNHPILTNAKAELAEVRQSIQRENDGGADQLRLDVTLAETQLHAIKGQVETARSGLAQSKSTRGRLNELGRDVESSRRVYETMLERHQRLAEDQELMLDNARIISPANVPDKPSNISGFLLIGFTAAGSCAAGIGLAVLIEARRTGYMNAVEIEQDLGYPVLGLVPFVHRSRKAKSSGRWQMLEAYGLTEAVRSLVYAVLPNPDRHMRQAGKILAVTSSFPDEGKSTIALSLARQAGFSGLKTLLIEGDLRKPGFREGLSTIEPTIGLIDILRGHVNYADDAISTEPESGVDIMLGFGPAHDSFTLMRGDRMAQLLEAVQSRYDLIIIDAAPIMAVSETRSLVDLADETLFVIRWKTTERSAARTAVRDLERMNAKICGIVLNQIDLREHLKYEDADRLAYQDKYNQYAHSYRTQTGDI